MDFIYEVRVTTRDEREKVIDTRFFYTLQQARQYVYSLTQDNVKKVNTPKVIVNAQLPYYPQPFKCDISIYKQSISDSIQTRPRAMRMLLYDLSPEHQQIFDYLQIICENRFIPEDELRSNIDQENKIVDNSKFLLEEMVGNDIAEMVVNYLTFNINLNTLSTNLQKLKRCRAVKSFNFENCDGTRSWTGYATFG